MSARRLPRIAIAYIGYAALDAERRPLRLVVHKNDENVLADVGVKPGEKTELGVRGQ